MVNDEQDDALKPATQVVSTPLIGMVSFEPDTIVTAMGEAQRLTNDCRQTITVFTTDQQLYKVVVNALLGHPERFANFIPGLGGMHILMNYIGAAGALQANTGLEEIMQSAFEGLLTMLSGKRFLQNMRALRMVAEVVPEMIIKDADTDNHVISVLKKRSSKSRTAKPLIDNLIKPMMIMMTIVRAERDGDWPLYISYVTVMMPYLFASNYYDYVRYLFIH